MRREVIEGTICGHENGYAFLLPDDKTKEDFFIPHGDLRGAMHGDSVLAETTCGSGERTTARVLKVIKRGIDKVVGTYFTCKSGGFVSPDDRRYFCDVFVPFGKGLRARAGDKVVCKVLSYPKKKNPEGIITEIFGRQFEKNAELKSILFAYNLPQSFGKAAISEAKAVSKEPISFDGRKDFTGELIFTIDGEDAKDFDDAVSIKKVGENYVLGVHIADVSHFVKAGSALDSEAFERGTSVYFPEQVIPMLPEVLSNGVCSLKEGELRYTFSCVMTVNCKGVVENYEIFPSVIKSSARMTYTAVQKILDGDKKARDKYSHLVSAITLMDELTDILIEKRLKNGNIDLETADSIVTVDKNGKINVIKALQNKAQKIIEEFMILTNCTVAEFMYYAEKPFIYRIHEPPTEEKLDGFYEFLSLLGINAKRNREKVYPADFQKILKNAEDKPYYTVLNRVMLRSMQKARYSTEPKGHFGLGEKHYCHFTSPIRRYPDLAIHRIIKEFIALCDNGKDDEYSVFFANAAAYSSQKERNAENAERAVDDFYKILYISDFEGEEFDGIISGVKDFGLFVELACGIEGRVKVETLSGRAYRFNEKTYTLSNGKNTYRLGERVKIKVAGVNIITRCAEFIIV